MLDIPESHTESSIRQEPTAKARTHIRISKGGSLVTFKALYRLQFSKFGFDYVLYGMISLRRLYL